MSRLLGVIPLAALVAACGVDAVDAPTATPVISLETASGTLAGEVTGLSPGDIATLISAGPVTPSQPLVVHSPVVAELRVGDGQPSIHLRFLLVGQNDGLSDTSKSTRTWRVTREMHESALLEEEITAAESHELRFALEPGLYVLSVSAQWSGQGRDASYGFLLSVVGR